jgi:hypothetical protein
MSELSPNFEWKPGETHAHSIDDPALTLLELAEYEASLEHVASTDLVQ